MRAALSRWFDAIRTGFWFVPLVMLAAAAALAVLLLHVDRTLDPGTEASFGWAYSGGPEGARSLLSTIAGSMITAASVTFSLASVALSIASQQYGSRVLRNFMRDRITQVLLGTFVATFIYSVLVVRTIRGTDYSGGFVPAISVTIALGLALFSLVLLIYFIHHVSASIQASRIVRVIAEDLEEAIPRLYPSETGEPQDDPGIALAFQQRGVVPLTLEQSGYVQTIDLDSLLEVACQHDLILRLLLKPGDHVLAGSVVTQVWGKPQLQPHTIQQLRESFYVDRERTPAQDIRYHFQQLTDVVVRALSPGINDPFTAINGIDELAAAMLLFVQSNHLHEQRRDDEGILRLIAPFADTSEVLTNTVGHIAVYAASDPFVMDSLRRVLDTVEPHLRQPEALATIAKLRTDLGKRQQSESALKG